MGLKTVLQTLRLYRKSELVWENDKPVRWEIREPSGGDLESNLHYEYSHYRIFKKGNKYTLRVSGYQPKEHWYYQKALEELENYKGHDG